MTTDKLDSLPQRPKFKSAMFSILCVAVVAVFVLPAAMSQRSHPHPQTPAIVTDNELQVLLEARRDVLKAASETSSLYLTIREERSAEDYWDIVKLEVELSKLELELAQTKQDRIDVLKKTLGVVAGMEEQLQMRNEPKLFELLVKAERLRIEIELHKVKKSP